MAIYCLQPFFWAVSLKCCSNFEPPLAGGLARLILPSFKRPTFPVHLLVAYGWEAIGGLRGGGLIVWQVQDWSRQAKGPEEER